MRSAWPHQRKNDQDRHCVATVLPHNAMFSLTFAGVASVDLSEPPFCNVLSFAVIRRYSAACHTTSYSGENGLVWYGPHDLIVGHAGRGMIFVRCSRPGSGENGKIFRLVACRVLRLTPRKDLSCWQRRGRRAMGAAGCGGAQSALTDSRKPTEAVAGFHCSPMPSNGGGCSIRESRRIRRKCNDWPRRLWTRTSQGRQGPSAAGCGRTGRHAVVRHARRRPLRSVRRPTLCRSVWSGAVRQQGVRRLRQRGHSHSRSASCTAA